MTFYTFKREEQKYLLSEEKYNSMQKFINKYFLKDEYFESKIYNIYFDNDNCDLTINSLEKPKYKEKIRLRSYGVPNNNDIVFLEMKQKYKGTVYKRRCKMTLKEYRDYINKHIFKNSQIMKEIDYYINYYKLHPYMFIAYDRLSYYAKDNKNFRITFDNKLRSRTKNLELKDNEKNKYYFKNNTYIMEVKCEGSLPLWFIHYLSENKIYPQSFSKIGNIYRKEEIYE